MRENKRYLLVEGKNLRENLGKAVKDFIGVLGMSKASLSTIKFGEDWIVVSVNRESVNHVRAAIAAWPEKIEVKKVSGTLKGLRG